MAEHLKTDHYPLESVEKMAQAQANVPKDSKVLGKGNLPTIEVHHNSGTGVIGSASPVNVNPSAKREHYDIAPTNPEANMHDQFVKPDGFDSPAAFK